jgi:fructose-bisphosphate aldolase class I
VAGVAFLSGGQGNEEATRHLDAINRRDGGPAPWPLSFSYARALQQPALAAWRGDNANIAAAQNSLLQRARCNCAAARGCYDPAQEKQVA